MMNVANASASRIPAVRSSLSSLLAASALALVAGGAQAADGSTYYQCPGNVFTNTITPKEADAKGCKAMVGAAAHHHSRAQGAHGRRRAGAGRVGQQQGRRAGAEGARHRVQ